MAYINSPYMYENIQIVSNLGVEYEGRMTLGGSPVEGLTLANANPLSNGSIGNISNEIVELMIDDKIDEIMKLVATEGKAITHLSIINSNFGTHFKFEFDITTATSGGNTYYTARNWKYTCGPNVSGTNTNSYTFAGRDSYRRIRYGHLRFAFDFDNYRIMPIMFLQAGQNQLGNAYSLRNGTYSENVLFVVFSDSIAPPIPSSDPYANGGYSTGTDTGTGTFDDTSESVPLPTTYAFSATASGLMSQYVLTEANLAAFGSWLWNGGTIVDDLKHFFQSPMEAIFSVGILPFTPSDTTPYNVYVGALAATGVQGGLVGDTVEKISCGSIDFDGYYGGALDYNPYTKIELFLPYCGTLTLNADEVMGHTISVDYYCDTITGDCVAFVSDEERVLHQVRGNCFIQIPLAARDFTALYSSAIAAIGTIAAGLATAASGGLSAPVAVGMGSSMAANAMNAKTHIARAGGVSGMAGFMSIQKPYIIMTIPNQCLPEFQNEMQGYPLFVTKRLGDFSGFTKVYEIHLDGLDCTDAEAKEIYELLKGGVVL